MRLTSVWWFSKPKVMRFTGCRLAGHRGWVRWAIRSIHNRHMDVLVRDVWRVGVHKVPVPAAEAGGNWVVHVRCPHVVREWLGAGLGNVTGAKGVRERYRPDYGGRARAGLIERRRRWWRISVGGRRPIWSCAHSVLLNRDTGRVRWSRKIQRTDG